MFSSGSLRPLRYLAFIPALLFGAWLVVYTQRQAARPQSVDDLINKAVATSSDPFQIDLDLAPEVIQFDSFINYGEPISSIATDDLPPHVIRVTSKRIEMPVFNTRKVTTQPTVWLGDTVTASAARKGIEPWLADFIDRLSRGLRGKATTP